jgi:general secretion pathway protein F
MDFRLDIVRGVGEPLAMSVAATNADEAIAQATAMGYSVLSCRPQSRLLELVGGPRRARFDEVVFVEQLGELLQAGLSIGEALVAIRENGGAQQSVAASLEAELRGGRGFADALRRTGRFPELLIALARSSELTSDLPSALSRYAEHSRRIADLRHKLIATAVYPCLLLIVGAMVMGFLLLYVVPRFARVFEGLASLPWSAQAMLWWSQVMRDHGWALGGAVTLTIAGLAAIFGSWSARSAALRWALATGASRTALRGHYLARWFRALALLIDGGIPLPQALALSRALLPQPLAELGTAVETGIQAGLSPSQAHAVAEMTTPVAQQLLAAGERSGNLGAAYGKAAEFHERELSRSLERAMRAAEPLVMIGVGIGVGVIVVLMYLPIFELASAIQ